MYVVSQKKIVEIMPVSDAAEVNEADIKREQKDQALSGDVGRRMPRQVKPDAEKIRRVCDKKGWRAADLADAAKITLAKADKIMKGELCYRKALMIVAMALGKEYVDLLEGGAITGSPARKTI
jgi:hypothetical protein